MSCESANIMITHFFSHEKPLVLLPYSCISGQGSTLMRGVFFGSFQKASTQSEQNFSIYTCKPNSLAFGLSTISKFRASLFPSCTSESLILCQGMSSFECPNQAMLMLPPERFELGAHTGGRANKGPLPLQMGAREPQGPAVPLLEPVPAGKTLLWSCLCMTLPRRWGWGFPSPKQVEENPKFCENLLSVTDSLILKLQRTLSTLRACRKPFPLTTTWKDSETKNKTKTA